MADKRIVMVDIWSVCDENGKPIGHGGKVGNEYYRYINDRYEVVQYVNESMLPHLISHQKVAFAHSIKNGIRKSERIIGNFRCLREVYKKEKDPVIWFYVPDIYLFLYVWLVPKGKRRILVNVYETYSGSRIKNWIFYQALRKIDTVFVTNGSLLSEVPGGVLISDYAYDEALYGRYHGLPEQERVVCLGTMNEKKQLEEAVDIFSKNGYPLYIVGQFTSRERYEQLCRMKSDNIIIEDRYVDPDEYYRLLAESRYCLLPYDAGFYRNRTSGVIQECLFCDTIPIAHADILRFSHICGVGYKDIQELSKIDLKTVDPSPIRAYYESERDRYYRYDVIKDKVVKAIARI